MLGQILLAIASFRARYRYSNGCARFLVANQLDLTMSGTCAVVSLLVVCSSIILKILGHGHLISEIVRIFVIIVIKKDKGENQ